MNKQDIIKIQRQGHFDIGRMLTESELRELAYLETGSSCFTWGDILDYVSNNALEYSVDFIKEVQTNYAKEYAEEKHASKAKGLVAAKKNTQISLIYIIRDELMKINTNKKIELMKKLQRGGYFTFFE